MKKNLGTLDRVVRALLGLAFFCLGITFGLAGYLIISIILGIFGVLMVVETIMGFCWLYKWFGIDKTKKKRKR